MPVRIFVFLGCLPWVQALAQEGEVPSDQGRICAAFGGPVEGIVPLTIDGVPAADLQAGTFVCVDVQPGEHQLVADGVVNWQVCVEWEPVYRLGGNDIRCSRYQTERDDLKLDATVDVAGGDAVARVFKHDKKAAFVQPIRYQRLSGPTAAYMPVKRPLSDRSADAEHIRALQERLSHIHPEVVGLTARLQSTRGSGLPIAEADVEAVQRCLDAGWPDGKLLGAMQFGQPGGPLDVAMFQAGQTCALTPDRLAAIEAKLAEQQRWDSLPKEPLSDSLRRAMGGATPTVSARRLTTILQGEASGTLDVDDTAALVQLCADDGVKTSAMLDAVSATPDSDIVHRFATAGLVCGVERRLLAQGEAGTGE